MLRRLFSPLREFGPGAGLLYLADRVLSRLSPKLRVYAYDVVVQPVPQETESKPVSAHITVRRMLRGDPALERLPVTAEVVSARLDSGCACIGAFRRGELVAYMWYRPARYDEDEVRCSFRLHPPEQSAFDFDFYVFPEHRFGRAFAALWQGANRLLAQQGVHHSFSRVSRFNQASRRAHAHLGARCIGRAIFLRAWNLQLTIASLRPYAHLGVGAHAVPCFDLALNEHLRQPIAPPLTP